jgi:LPXTG-motif cell wall-anchored protein
MKKKYWFLIAGIALAIGATGVFIVKKNNEKK